MGYTTEFSGKLEFTKELTASELAYLNTFLGELPQDHKEWVHPTPNKESYIQFELTKDYSGIQWDGGEKFYYAVEAVNLIIQNMVAKYKDFGLKGSLNASGEEFGDMWILLVEDNVAKRVDIPVTGEKIKCPHCDEYFYYNK